MNHLVNIVRKELKELLTPGTILSVVVVVIMLMAVGSAISGEAEKAGSPAQVGVYYGPGEGHDAADGDLTDGAWDESDIKLLVQTAYASMYGTDASVAADNIHYLADGGEGAIVSSIKDMGLAYAISIPDNMVERIDEIASLGAESPIGITAYYVYEDRGALGSASSSAGSSLISNMSSLLSDRLVVAQTGAGEIPSALLIQPLTWGNDLNRTYVNGETYGDITPYAISSAMMGQSLMIPIVVMLVIVMVGSVVISSMGSEKENKTLETLLTMPIKRTTIVSGKLLAAAIMGLFYGVAYLIGMLFYTSGITAGEGSTDLAQYGLSMGAADWALLLVVLFLSIFSALGICMILGAFTKNYKMAQTMTMPISALAIIPMFVFMFTSWSALPGAAQVAMFAIPFSHPMMAMNNLMFGDLALVAGGIIYLVVFDLITILITVRVYNSDILITGLGQTKFVRKIMHILGREERHEDN